jgi:hypothetical protein
MVMACVVRKARRLAEACHFSMIKKQHSTIRCKVFDSYKGARTPRDHRVLQDKAGS